MVLVLVAWISPSSLSRATNIAALARINEVQNGRREGDPAQIFVICTRFELRAEEALKRSVVVIEDTQDGHIDKSSFTVGSDATASSPVGIQLIHCCLFLFERRARKSLRTLHKKSRSIRWSFRLTCINITSVDASRCT